MDDKTRVIPQGAPSTAPMTRPAGANAQTLERRRRFPTVYYLRQHARRRIPKFGFDATDGGAGTDGGIARNAAALRGAVRCRADGDARDRVAGR